MFKNIPLLKVVTVSESCPSYEVTSDGEKVYKFWKDTIEKHPFFDSKKEMVVVLLMDMQFKVEGWEVVSLGTLNSSLVSPREVFRLAVNQAAASIIVIHNHPSGNPMPSPADRAVSSKLRDSGEILGIKLLDFVVIGNKDKNEDNLNYYSFAESGLV